MLAVQLNVIALVVMPLVCSPVGAFGATAAIVRAEAEAAADVPPVFLARTCKAYCVSALKPVNWYVATSPTSVQPLNTPPLTS